MTAPGTPPLPPPPGRVPATFRSDGLDDDGDEGEEIGMGALSLAAVLAIALAALRGASGALTDWRQRRMEAAAEAAPLRAARLKLREARMRADAASTTGGTGSGGRVPSSNEYGRRSLARTGPGGGGSGGGSGSGSSSGGRSGSGRSLASSGGPGSRPGSLSGSGGTGPDRKGPGGSSGSSQTGGAGKGKGPSGSGTGGGGGKGSSSGSSGSGPGSGAGSSGGSGTGDGRRPGVLGQLVLNRSKRRSAREAAAQKEAARRQKADLAERKRAGKDGHDDSKGTEEAGDGTASRPTGTDGSESAGTDRVTLGKAIGDEVRSRAEERLRRRREDPDPPVLRRVPRDDAETAEGAAATTTGDTSTDTTPKGPETAADDPAAPGPTPGPDTGTGPGAATAGTAGASTGAPGDSDPAAPGPAPGSGSFDPGATGDPYEFGPAPDDWAGHSGSSGGRRNPWDSLFEAMWDAEVVWTVERVDRPGDAAPRREPAAIGTAPAGLPAGTSPTTTAAAAAPGTTTKETRVSAPLIPRPGPAGVDSEHLTDVTLDDVLDALAKSKANCFTTYDECADLAHKATELKVACTELAERLRRRHNVIGRLTGAAMERLAESMDLLARKANHMRGESLKAAEAVEAAHNEMYDAYKPVQQAAADAGLVMPSARIHNED